MLAAITLLLVYQLVGEIVVVALGLPIPGPVIGMALLFVTLILRGAVGDDLRQTATGLLRHLSLLFVPAGVGVMAHLGRLTDEWWPIAVSLVVSTLVTIAVTALVMRALLARRTRGRETVTAPLADIWVYLQATPLLFLTLTLLVYQGAYWIYRRANFHPLLNPVASSIVVLVALLAWTGTPYETYFGGAQFVHFLLGPATVALAVPLYAQWDKLKRALLPIGAAMFAGAVTALVSAVGLAWALGASELTLLSIAPKSVTTPIAMGIVERLGGLPSLTAVLVVTTGIIGAIGGKYVLDALGITDHGVRGFALGTAAHGIGTARAFQESEEAGAFSGLAMGLCGLVTAVLFPLGVWLVRALAS